MADLQKRVLMYHSNSSLKIRPIQRLKIANDIQGPLVNDERRLVLRSGVQLRLWFFIPLWQ